MHVISKGCLATLITLIFFSFAAPSQAAWRMEQVEGLGPDGPSMQSVVTFGKNRMRADNPQMKSSVIMDFAGDRMYILQHEQKAYVEMQIKAVAEQMQRILKTISEAQGTPDIQIKDSKKTETLNGFTCKKLTLIKEGKPQGEIWVTDRFNKAGIAETYRSFFQMTGAQNPNSPATAFFSGLIKTFEKGFPVKTVRNREDGKYEFTELRAAKEIPETADLFVPPAGYTKQTMPTMPGMPPAPPAGPKHKPATGRK